MRNLLGLFIVSVLYLTLVYHLTNAYFAKQVGVRALHPRRRRRLPGALLGGLRASSAASCRCSSSITRGFGGARSVLAASLLSIAGAFALLYVFIIGGQAWPLEIFPGYQASSSFGDGQITAYAPRLPELLLGMGGRRRRVPHHRDRRARAAVPAARTTRGGGAAARRGRTTDARDPRNPRRLLVSATHKSSGKTTISVGLCRALRERGLAVQPFKKGPDYIDPMWLTAATDRRCRNLDPYLSDDAEIPRNVSPPRGGADIAIVEGNKGLYDGLAHRRQQQQRRAGQGARACRWCWSSTRAA